MEAGEPGYPGWPALPRSHLHKKFDSITYNVLSNRLTGLIFLHINGAVGAGSRADIVHNINFKRALVRSLNFEEGWRQKKRKQT